MPHETPLIATIAIGLALASLLGLLAQRVKLPPIVGYLAAGIVIGPFTPGYVADQKIAVELAEIGVILLMFGVGLHFSLKDLLSVRAIAIPGAIGQIAVATGLGIVLGRALGWSWGAGILFGLALSVASTVVLLRALQERGQIETEKGRIAVGWLIVEDLVMVLTLVMVPALSGLLGGTPASPSSGGALVQALGVTSVWGTLLLTIAKVAVFAALMIVIGRRVIPSGLHYVAHTGSRELFRLVVMAIALGFAYGSAQLFGVSFALGAFFAGMVLAESELSTQAARETLPLRDAFAVLFFVSVGMLFNPAILLSAPLAVLVTFLIIVLGKSIAAYLIVRAFGHPKSVGLTISASLAQIGEFSFILIVLGLQLKIVPETARDLVVAGSILSIISNPLLFKLLDWLEGEAPLPVKAATAAPTEAAVATAEPLGHLGGHAIVVGHGRVGSVVVRDLLAKGVRLVVVDEEEAALAPLVSKGIATRHGQGGAVSILEGVDVEGARYLFSAIPDPFEAGHIIEAVRAVNPDIRAVARADTEEAITYLRSVGADIVLFAEEELGHSMVTQGTTSLA